MPRLSKPRITNKESYDLALAEADKERLTLLTKSLEGTFHFRQLTKPTLEGHSRTKKLWALFHKRHPLCDNLPAEMVPECFVVKKTIESYIFKFFALCHTYVFLPVPKVYRNHVMTYFYLKEFDETSKLSTKSHIKEVTKIVDIDILVKVPSPQNVPMTWDYHEFWVCLLKGHRKDDSYTKYFFLLPEPASHRHVNPVMYLLVNAFKDTIFVDVETPEQMFFPKNPCHTTHKLRINESTKSQVVTQKEVYQDGFWTMLDTLAMPYFMITAFLHKISLFLGFIKHHKANKENANMMKAVCGMSKGCDPNTPISLDAAEAKGKLHTQVHAKITKRASIDKDDNVVITAQNEVINALHMKIHTIDQEHAAIVDHETYALVALKRKKYFDEVSFWVPHWR
ncbi:hypothetical protein DFH08DRAFT_966201 [Mycena albidolilacea]|uniref:Uncharacterized protein n=1 Tax=Mycena albidolilacea TaxID=1033008 RepID=A0AAD7EKK9_9AGAR|nr:hypothetical protein DFH08DRAFT_966201 [Mycena albidolilacea]